MSWIRTALKTAGVVTTGAFVLNWWHTPKNQIVSLKGAPNPNTDIGATDFVRFTCESSGTTCTCDDVRDWIRTYWFGVDGNNQPGLCTLQIAAIQLAEKSDHSDDTARRVIRATLELAEEFRAKYDPPPIVDCKNVGASWVDDYDCSDISDDWILGAGGQNAIKGIARRIEDVRRYAGIIHSRWELYKKAGDPNILPPSDRPMDPELQNYDPDAGEGPDSGSIGLGLLAGGVIALALISSQPKKKGRI